MFSLIKDHEDKCWFLYHTFTRSRFIFGEAGVEEVLDQGLLLLGCRREPAEVPAHRTVRDSRKQHLNRHLPAFVQAADHGERAVVVATNLELYGGIVQPRIYGFPDGRSCLPVCADV